MIKKHVGIVRLMACLAGMAMLCAGLFGSPPALVAAASQWHVSSAGTNDENCGSSSSPCRTISYLLSLTKVTSGDQINVAGEIQDTFTLTKNVTIAGAAGAILDGNGARILTVNAGVSATLSNLTLRNGGGTQDGGLVYNAGTLLINNALLKESVVVEASGGAIFNTGTLTLNTSSVSNNRAHWGGGIENRGLLFITDSTISNNQALQEGGGIDNFTQGIMHLKGVVISANIAAAGAGIYNDPGLLSSAWLTNTAVVSNTAQNLGAAIFNNGHLSIVNATISNNHLPGGPGVALFQQSGSLSMQQVTVAGNTVANRADSSVAKLDGTNLIKNSVFANNGVDNCSGNAISSGYNLSSDATCNFNQPTDLNSTDPLLGSLQPTGGAFNTFSQTPLQGSLLVNRIPAGACSVAGDQLGTSRPQDGACEIGAVETIPVDLSVAAQASPASLPAGTPLTVQLTISNAGPAVATDVVITSDVPAGTTASCSSNALCMLSGTRLTMTLGTLNAGANIVASVQLVLQKGGNLAFTFNTGSQAWDRQINNNAASVSVQVLESADIGISLNAPQSVLAGAPFTLSVLVENQSEFAASAPAFTLTLPAQVTYQNYFGSNWTCSPNPGAIQCRFDSPLQPKGKSSVDILLSSGNAPAELQFIGNATSTTFDPNTSNNTDNRSLSIGNQVKTFIPVVVR